MKSLRETPNPPIETASPKVRASVRMACPDDPAGSDARGIGQFFTVYLTWVYTTTMWE